MDILPSELISSIITYDNFHILVKTCKRINSICSSYIKTNLTLIVLNKCNDISANIRKVSNFPYVVKIYEIANRMNLFPLLRESSINILLHYNDNVHAVEKIINCVVTSKDRSKRIYQRDAFIHCQQVWMLGGDIPIIISDIVSSNMSFLFTEEQYYHYMFDWDDFRIWFIHYNKYMFSDHPYIDSILIVIKSCYQNYCGKSPLLKQIIAEADIYPSYITVFRYMFHRIGVNRGVLVSFISSICHNKEKLSILMNHL